MKAREAERALIEAGAELLDEVSHRSGPRPEVVAPIVAAPHLVPIHDEVVAADPAQCPGRQQREVWERRGVDHVVGAAVAEQVPQYPGAKDKRRQDPASPVRGVEPHAWPRRDHVYTRDLTPLYASPLAQREVGQLVSIGGQPFGEVAIPSLGAADGVGEQAVVDQADTHGAGDRGLQTFRYHRRRRATSSVLARFYGLAIPRPEVLPPEPRGAPHTPPL